MLQKNQFWKLKFDMLVNTTHKNSLIAPHPQVVKTLPQIQMWSFNDHKKWSLGKKTKPVYFTYSYTIKNTINVFKVLVFVFCIKFCLYDSYLQI